jgi:hypothetical protein
MPTEHGPCIPLATPHQRVLATCTWTKCALRLLLLLIVTCAAADHASAEIYRGLLVPEGQSPPIPVTVALEYAQEKISGQLTTSAPLSGAGHIVSGQRQRSKCSFKGDIGAARRLAFEGYCLPSGIEGTYTAIFPDGSLRRGTYRLPLVERGNTRDDKKAADIGPDRSRSTTACISANSACLGACPRGDYNAEFVCSNRCRQKFAACKAKAANLPVTPP